MKNTMQRPQSTINIVFFLIFTIFLGLCLPVAAHAKSNPLYASIVIDADTGAILSQDRADKPLHPASLTKMMTLLMLFEAIEQGKLRMSDSIPISAHAASMPPSKIGLKPGSSIKVRDAIGALVTKSANDIAAAVGEKLAGSERNFGRMMTARARELGMARTTFVNASGLHDSGQISTARDIATLARVIISGYPAYYRHFSTANFTYRGQSYHNHNHLMKTYAGMDGMKTGFIRQSGFNLAASAVQNNHRLIGVVFGGRTAASRNTHMASLLDRGFAQIRGGAVRYASATVPLPDMIAPSYAPPTPPRRPGVLVAYDTLNRISNSQVMTAGMQQKQPQAIAAVETPYSDTAEVMNIASLSQGDAAEPDAFRDAASGMAQPAAFTPPHLGGWSIQVGAFSSRAASDSSIASALRKLPPQFRQGSPAIAPLKTADGWVFRARLAGYNQDQAESACRYLKDCMAIAP